MSLTASQAYGYLKPKTVRGKFSGIASSRAIGFTTYASKIEITEFGCQVHSHTDGTGITFQIRTPDDQTALYNNHNRANASQWGAEHWTGSFSGIPAEIQAPAPPCTAIWHPPVGTIQLANTGATELHTGRKVCQGQIKLNVLLADPWAGYIWIKYVILDKELYT